MVRKLKYYLCLLILLISTPHQTKGESSFHRELAEFYAPVVYQESHSEHLDYLSKFDFDGDWNGANNWDNAYLFDLEAYVYYSVIESTSHYFITYAFFHPRDYTGKPMEGFAPKMEHENDLEGCTLTVEKGDSLWGELILLETLAHDKFFIYTKPSNRKVSARNANIHGSILFPDPNEPSRPGIFIEAEGHGVMGASPEILETGFQAQGLTYRYSGRGAEVPDNAWDTDVSYALIPIETSLWEKRFAIGPESTYCCGDEYRLGTGETVVIWGESFNGPVGGCAARPPWAWDEKDDGPIEKGDWFRNPLTALAYQLDIEGMGLEYLHNPYLDEPQENPPSGSLCTEADSSKTVKESLTETLIGIGVELISGGVSTEQISNKADDLFMTNTVLLEWFSVRGLGQWDWGDIEVVEPHPLFATGLSNNSVAISLSKTRPLISPAFRAPARYFDTIVLKYKCSTQAAAVKVYWLEEGTGEFDKNRSAEFQLECSGKWTSRALDLSSSEGWDSTVNIVRLKLEARNSSASAPGESSEVPLDSLEEPADLRIHAIVFDRAAFADTFTR